jgi:hypothetical protein
MSQLLGYGGQWIGRNVKYLKGLRRLHIPAIISTIGQPDRTGFAREGMHARAPPHAEAPVDVVVVACPQSRRTHTARSRRWRTSDDATIAMFSDWGTGLYGATVITKTIGALPRCDVALHLGDTYYSGNEDEIKDRLIGGWPKRTNTLNRALNGNHEMYSGGQEYFEALASFFKL